MDDMQKWCAQNKFNLSGPFGGGGGMCKNSWHTPFYSKADIVSCNIKTRAYIL